MAFGPGRAGPKSSLHLAANSGIVTRFKGRRLRAQFYLVLLFKPASRESKPMAFLSFLDREHSVAPPGYSRWLVPPAALAIHLSIGQAYAFSVFKIPLTQLLGINKSIAGDWKQSQVAWIF